MNLFHRLERRTRAVKHKLQRAIPWRWRLKTFHDPAAPLAHIRYLGPEMLERDATALFFGNAEEGRVEERCNATVVAVPLEAHNDWLQVPSHLRCIVEIDAKLDDLVERWNSDLRRKLKKALERTLRIEVVRNVKELERLYHEFFVPFAEHRHKGYVNHYTWHDFIDFARQGEVTRVLADEQPIGAELGLPYYRGTRRIWAALRYGYPEKVFADMRTLSEANLILNFMQLRRACERGYAAYDLGLAEARPSSGLLEFKRRRRATMIVPSEAARFWVHAPLRDRPRLFARTPLFSVHQHRLWLNLGVARDEDDAAVISKFASFSFRGVHAVKVHSERFLSERLCDGLQQTVAAPLYSTFIP